MGAISDIQIPKTRFFHPQRNLPGRGSGHTAEGRFTNAFIRAYIAQMKRIHSGSKKSVVAFAREVPVNGYGIADIVCINWDPAKNDGMTFPSAKEFIQNATPTIRSFEVKLSDWRTGMLQAHRYRFYSNAGILVLPTKQLIKAQRFLHTFKAIGVGLWGFDDESNVITTIYTPRPSKARDPRYVAEALQKVQTASKALPFRKTVRAPAVTRSGTRRRPPVLD